MARNAPQDLLAVAHVARPHGVLGEVSAIPLAPPVLDPLDLIVERVIHVRDAKGGVRQFRGEGVRGHQDRWLVKLEGIESMTDADTLRACDLCLPRAELPALPEGWYWESEIEGCRVLDGVLGEIGIALGLETGYVQTQLKLRRPDGRTVLIPLVKALIKNVDTAARLIETDLPAEFPGISD